ncbi:serine/threonine-protein phosphatase [Streptomyces sp. P38-E01]|uniref:Serine/threonine-protein phosphatase n=1 Tax=Streptomyces tardus TaxID=2780544 RepID=A0A949N4N2_9ACTN|nr:serine/threonine-protein phosphatase [Streptomyces tardus]
MEAVDVVAQDLLRRFGATRVSFLIVDLTGRAIVPLTTASQQESVGQADRIELHGSVYERVVRTQQLYRETTTWGERVICPVTNRGDAIGLLELLLPTGQDEATVHAVGEAAHALAYIMIANQRYTDLYTWGKRSRPLTLAAEIQHQLLPPSLTCEGAQFALCGTMEPSNSISGDTFDYTLDRDTLHLSLTDPMGHDIEAALAATILVSALRGARRNGADLLEQARQADQALAAHGPPGHATGQLVRVDLHTGQARLVNAGHPWPLRMRDGIVEEVALEVDPPFGLPVPIPHPHRVQELDLRPGDRLIMLTDGMLEQDAERVDLAAVLKGTRNLHPRETVLALTSAVLDAVDGRLEDDATVLCLDWHGSGETERQVASGADIRQASPRRTAP